MRDDNAPVSSSGSSAAQSFKPATNIAFCLENLLNGNGLTIALFAVDVRYKKRVGTSILPAFRRQQLSRRFTESAHLTPIVN
jgi:hypothetical protein